jgi:hypothetical protein
LSTVTTLILKGRGVAMLDPRNPLWRIPNLLHCSSYEGRPLRAKLLTGKDQRKLQPDSAFFRLDQLVGEFAGAEFNV